MKKLILITILLSGSISFGSSCTIQGQVKKEGAKTIYVNGESISLKKLTKMACKVETTVMSKEQARTMKIEKLKKQLKKLGV